MVICLSRGEQEQCGTFLDCVARTHCRFDHQLWRLVSLEVNTTTDTSSFVDQIACHFEIALEVRHTNIGEIRDRTILSTSVGLVAAATAQDLSPSLARLPLAILERHVIE